MRSEKGANYLKLVDDKDYPVWELRSKEGKEKAPRLPESDAICTSGWRKGEMGQRTAGIGPPRSAVETGSYSITRAWSALAQSWLTEASKSWAQLILLPQPPK
ncbi:hypothetical protein AAY473_035124 [Plecturocebus cupreus]